MREELKEKIRVTCNSPHFNVWLKNENVKKNHTFPP